jgi:carboxyl-terminal processing protease
LLTSLIFASPAVRAADGELQCRFLSAIEQGFLSQHIKYSQRDATLQDHLVDQYIKRVDPTKVYLLKADVEKVKSLMANIFDKTKAKDCTALDQIQKFFLSV